MPRIAILGGMCTGHNGFGARPGITANQKLTVGGIPVMCVGDQFDEHCDDESCHTGVITTGSSKFSLGGIPVALVGSQIDCGSTIAEGAPKLTISS